MQNDPERAHRAFQCFMNLPTPQTADSVARNPHVPAETERILSGWGASAMDAAFLEAAPNLRVVLYGAGSIRHVATPALWDLVALMA